MNVKDLITRVKVSKPEAWVAGGVAVMTGTAIYGCVKCYKLKDELKQTGTDIAKAAELKEKAETDEEKKEAVKALKTAKTKKVLAIATAVGPVIAGETIGGCMIFRGTKMLRSENLALAAAYATLDGTLRAYRKRVQDKYGEETEKELYYGLEKKEFTVTETDEEGHEKKTKVKGYVAGPGLSAYARYFAYGDSEAAEKNDEYNETFILGMESDLNRVLVTKGYLTLNQWYEAYGYKPTLAGQDVGWVYDQDSDDHGDNRINVFKEQVYRKNEHTGKYEKVWILDPNVDGDIRSHLLKIGLVAEI